MLSLSLNRSAFDVRLDLLLFFVLVDNEALADLIMVKRVSRQPDRESKRLGLPCELLPRRHHLLPLRWSRRREQ